MFEVGRGGWEMRIVRMGRLYPPSGNQSVPVICCFWSFLLLVPRSLVRGFICLGARGRGYPICKLFCCMTKCKWTGLERRVMGNG